MASIAEFYSRNLATEIPQGVNPEGDGGRHADQGSDRLPERARSGRRPRDPHHRARPRPGTARAAGVELYASGDFSLSELAAILKRRGLTTRPTPRFTAKPLSISLLQRMLRNDYYVGVVRYGGKSYPGRHEPLISLDLFQRVQVTLDARFLAAERDRVHTHYLKGSLYCNECGARLVFSRHTGRHGGTFDYFLCRGRQQRRCNERYRPVADIEAAVARYWATVQISEAQRERCRAIIHERFDGLVEVARREITRAAKTLEALRARRISC